MIPKGATVEKCICKKCGKRMISTYNLKKIKTDKGVWHKIGFACVKCRKFVFLEGP